MSRGRRRSTPAAGTRSGAVGLLGLGGYGLGLCAIGVAGIATPLLHSGDPGDGASDAAAAPADPNTPAGRRTLDFDLGRGGAPGSVLVAAAAVRPRVTPRGVPTSTSGVPGAVPGDAAARRSEFRPTLFVLPSGRTAKIQQAGLLSDGSLAVPENPRVVGWWSGGAFAGEPFGSTVIAGHVDSLKYGFGAFAELGKTRKGAVLEVRAADGHKQRYTVVTIQKIAQAKLGTETDAFRQDVPHRLVVITCGGPFDRAKHRYLDNIVITAVPIR